MRLNTDRGMNLHRHSDMKFKKGALILSKENVQKYTQDGGYNKYSHLDYGKSEAKKDRLTYEEIVKRRETNSEFATGKKYKRTKGSFKKLNNKFKKR